MSDDEKKELKESSGGYMSVDRTAALEKNWELIKGITLPVSGVTSPTSSEEAPSIPKVVTTKEVPPKNK